MKVFTALLFAASQLVVSTMAHDGFFVYGGKTHTGPRHQYTAWSLFPSPEGGDCRMVNEYKGYLGMNDVSGDKKGVACDGNGCPQTKGDPQRIDRVEMNVEFGHYTWYKSRDNSLVDLGDRVVGKCFEQHEKFESHQLHCTYPTDKGEQFVDIWPYLWCDTNVWN